MVSSVAWLEKMCVQGTYKSSQGLHVGRCGACEWLLGDQMVLTVKESMWKIHLMPWRLFQECFLNEHGISTPDCLSFTPLFNKHAIHKAFRFAHAHLPAEITHSLFYLEKFLDFFYGILKGNFKHSAKSFISKLQRNLDHVLITLPALWHKTLWHRTRVPHWDTKLSINLLWNVSEVFVSCGFPREEDFVKSK